MLSSCSTCRSGCWLDAIRIQGGVSSWWLMKRKRHTDLMRMPTTPCSVNIRLNWHCQSRTRFRGNRDDQHGDVYWVEQICITPGSQSNEVWVSVWVCVYLCITKQGLRLNLPRMKITRVLALVSYEAKEECFYYGIRTWCDRFIILPSTYSEYGSIQRQTSVSMPSFNYMDEFFQGICICLVVIWDCWFTNPSYSG